MVEPVSPSILHKFRLTFLTSISLLISLFHLMSTYEGKSTILHHFSPFFTFLTRTTTISAPPQHLHPAMGASTKLWPRLSTHFSPPKLQLHATKETHSLKPWEFWAQKTFLDLPSSFFPNWTNIRTIFHHRKVFLKTFSIRLNEFLFQNYQINRPSVPYAPISLPKTTTRWWYDCRAKKSSPKDTHLTLNVWGHG